MATEAGHGRGNTSQAWDSHDRARISELEHRVRQLEQENAFLVKAAAFFAKKSE